MRRVGSVILVACVVITSLASVRCYDATEMIVELRTNLACETFQPQTQIKLGGGQVVADTSTCGPPAVGAADEERMIGTLNFVPSKDRNAQVTVEVILAVKGTRPDECGVQPDKCIVAKRSFSFIEHASRRLPIVLRSQCLGKICPAGQTCVEGGQCVLVDQACKSEGCGDTTPVTPPTPTGTSPNPTVDAGVPPPCVNGDRRCNEKQLEECTNGQFELKDLCETAEACLSAVDGACPKVATMCNPGDVKCGVSETIRQCKQDGSGFVTVESCTGATPKCLASNGIVRCAACNKIGQLICDYSCDVSGHPEYNSTNDCLLKCNPTSGVYVFAQDCGIAQHGLFSESCRVATMGGAECFQ